MVYVGWFGTLIMGWQFWMPNEVEAWLSKTSFGVSLLLMLNLVNLLFIAYLSLVLYANVATESRRNAVFYASQGAGLVLVLLAQVVLFRMVHLAANWRDLLGPEYLAWECKQRAEGLLLVGDSEEAVDEFTKALALFPDADGYESRGRAHNAMGRYDLAAEDFTEAIRLHRQDWDHYPTAIEAHLAWLHTRRGRAYYEMGQYDRATSDFCRALELDCLPFEPYNTGSLPYSERGPYGYAAGAVSKAIAVRPGDPFLYRRRGAALEDTCAYESAIEDYTRAIRLAPGQPAAYWLRAGAYMARGKPGPAIEDYTRLIEFDPNDEAAYYNRARAYCRHEDYERAIEDYTRVLEIDSVFVPDVWAYYFRATDYRCKGDLPSARADFRKAIKVAPQSNAATWARGILSELGQDETD